MHIPRCVLLASLAAAACLAQAGPNVEAQKTAMKKLAFLTGKWSGDASVQRGPGEPLKIRQSEEIAYRLDGSILIIEGTGRDRETGKVVFNAFAVVTYDDIKKEYRIEAFNDGRKVDSPLEVTDNGFVWGFRSGPAEIRNTMKVTEKGEWSETTTAKMGERPEFVSVRMLLEHTAK